MAIDTPPEKRVALSPSSAPLPSLVLDSSAIASIFFRDRFEQLVARTIQKCDNLVTVDLAFAEVGSVAWKSVVIFKQAIDPVFEALRQASEFIWENCKVVASKEVLNGAIELGTRHRIQIYDSLFLCLARDLKIKLLTTDERLHNKLKDNKELKEITLLPE